MEVRTSPARMQFNLIEYHRVTYGPMTLKQANDLIAKAIRKYGHIFDAKG